MKRYEMVKSHEDFNDIINNGQKNGNKYLIIFSKTKEYEKPNFGIAVGKKVGNAVERNKLKRQLRVIIDKNRFLFKKNHNYIIMIKKEAKFVNFQKLEEEFVKLFGKDNYEK